jgi:hypothetical protein
MPYTILWCGKKEIAQRYNIQMRVIANVIVANKSAHIKQYEDRGHQRKNDCNAPPTLNEIIAINHSQGEQVHRQDRR